MALYELTLPLRPEHPPWPGDTPFSKTVERSIEEGTSHCNVSILNFSSHFGTHMDAPYHFEKDGITLDRIPLDTLIGPVLIHEVDTPDLIKPEHLPDLKGIERIVFKTSNTNYIADTEFHTDFVSVGLEAAKELTKAGIKLIGIDYFSIEAFRNPGHPVHHELCGNGVILVEGLDLRKVSPGNYELIVLPMNIQGGDGSPCRAVLRD
jgi:arylformamidase